MVPAVCPPGDAAVVERLPGLGDSHATLPPACAPDHACAPPASGCGDCQSRCAQKKLYYQNRFLGFPSEFNEKPQATGGRISGGFFVCRADLFDYLGEREDLVFEEEPMRALVRDRQLAVYEHDDFWQCMDTYRDWQFLNGLIEKNKAPWKIW